MPLPTETNPDFRRRLGYYFTGLAIGLVLLGLLYAARQPRSGSPAQPAPQNMPR
ncbi:MAG: hypothetical protein JNK25_13070 [Phycisphaerae bacterium]|nr:hypothetical protein [Phycisphaerae bacterium]